MKGIVIYFSHTGENWMKGGIEVIDKGNTEIVAEKIASLTGADLFKVEPVKEYAKGYYACCDEAKAELEKDERPKIKKELSDISNYDTVFIGGPIWWEHLPMPMFTQLEKLNFVGKIVYPFSTHEGSGLGEIMQDVKKLCSGSTIKQGLAIYGHDVNNCENVLKTWLE